MDHAKCPSFQKLDGILKTMSHGTLCTKIIDQWYTCKNDRENKTIEQNEVL
jgi:hypothetical protein